MKTLDNRAVELTNEYLGFLFNENDKWEAHQNLFKGFNEAKQKGLFDIFGDQLIYEKEIEYTVSREELRREIRNSHLQREIEEAIDKKILKMSREFIRWFDEGEYAENCRSIQSAVFLITNLNVLVNGVFDRTISFTSPITNRVVKIQEGAKVARALKHFITNKETLDKIQVKYSQIFNTKTTKGTLCLSIHPVDYLTVSVNKNGWESCFNTLDRGCWCASTLSLISSPNTIVAYLKSKDDVSYESCGRTFDWNNKKWRTYLSLSDDSELVHVGRHYPYESDTLMIEAMKMLEELVQKSYKQKTEKNLYYRVCYVSAPDNFYNDAESDCKYLFSTEKFDNVFAVYGEQETINISSIGAICPKCGCYYCDFKEDICCGECGGVEECQDCGRRESDMIYIEGYGFVCDCCIEEYDWCSNCETYHLEGHTTLVRYEERDPDVVANSFFQEHYYRKFLCLACIEENENYVRCPECGEWFDKELLKDGATCKDCLVRNKHKDLAGGF